MTAGVVTLLATSIPSGDAAARKPVRLLLVFAPSDADPSLREQRAILHQDSAGVLERDVSVLEVIGDRDDAGAFRARYHVPLDAFTVVLVGKDGGEKLRLARPVSEAALFAEIDKMPMRRDEIARRKGQP